LLPLSDWPRQNKKKNEEAQEEPELKEMKELKHLQQEPICVEHVHQSQRFAPVL
jgi:hypothetical protein